MKLQAVVDKLLEENNWTQTELGKKIGLPQTTVSNMRLSKEWEEHWQAILKLMPLAEQIGVPLKKLRD